MTKTHTQTLTHIVQALVCAFAFFFLVNSSAFAQSSAGADIDSRWHRDVAAGPYSTVSTAYGGMATSIPLFSVPGPNGSTMDFTISHRSNTKQGYWWAVAVGTPGAGWYHSYDSILNVSNDTTQTVMGNGAGKW